MSASINRDQSCALAKCLERGDEELSSAQKNRCRQNFELRKTLYPPLVPSYSGHNFILRPWRPGHDILWADVKFRTVIENQCFKQLHLSIFWRISKFGHRIARHQPKPSFFLEALHLCLSRGSVHKLRVLVKSISIGRWRSKFTISDRVHRMAAWTDHYSVIS